MTTMREIHERCKARHSDLWTHPATHNTYCVRCDLPAPCEDYSDAVAALNLLDDATQFYCEHLWEAPELVVIRDLVPDPKARA